jgi:hypothetical protein
MRVGLKVAEPITPDPTSFEEFLALVGKEFRITDIEAIEMPDWHLGTLFGGV